MLTDQLDAINKRYERKKTLRFDNFGLLNGARKFLDYKIYRHSADPEKKSLILVYFSDRVLNMKAEEIKIRCKLTNKFLTLPFLVEA